jgi:hypothetical protein
MLQYTIENAGGCCGGGLGADIIPAGHCEAPVVTTIHPTPAAAKAAGQDTWGETRRNMYVCFPRTLCIAGWFKGLQRAVNSYVEEVDHGASKVRVDAQIGPETFAAVKKVAMNEGMAGPVDTNDLVKNHAYWSNQIADWAGVPLDVSIAPRQKPEEIQQNVTDEAAAAAGTDTGKGGWWGRNWKWVALAGLGLGAAGLTYSIWRSRQEEAGLLPARAARGH